MQQGDIFGEINLAVIEQEKRVGIIQVWAHLIGIRIFREEVT
jgi:hypothetical protein